MVYFLLACDSCIPNVRITSARQSDPTFGNKIAYAVSLSIKECLIFVFPLIIFSYIFRTIASLSRNQALLLVAVIVGSYCISNFFTTWVAYFLEHLVSTQSWMTSQLKLTQSTQLNASWDLKLPSLLAN